MLMYFLWCVFIRVSPEARLFDGTTAKEVVTSIRNQGPWLILPRWHRYQRKRYNGMPVEWFLSLPRLTKAGQKTQDKFAKESNIVWHSSTLAAAQSHKSATDTHSIQAPSTAAGGVSSQKGPRYHIRQWCLICWCVGYNEMPDNGSIDGVFLWMLCVWVRPIGPQQASSLPVQGIIICAGAEIINLIPI